MGYLLAQNAVNGVLVGLIYALMSVGLTLQFGILRVVNFGYGALYLVGGYVAFSFVTFLGLNFWAALFISFVLLFLAGMAVERVGFNYFRGNEMNVLVFGVGLMVALRGIAMIIWGAQGHGIPPPVTGGFSIGEIYFSAQRMAAGGVSIGLFGLLHLFLRRTRLGKVMRCVADSPQRAEMLGIDVTRTHILAMGLGTAISAIAASVLATIFVVGPEIDMAVLFKSFIIIILSGMGNVVGALVGGLILGFVETFAFGFLSNPMWGTVIPFIMLVIILVFRPQGIFGTRERVT